MIVRDLTEEHLSLSEALLMGNDIKSLYPIFRHLESWNFELNLKNEDSVNERQHHPLPHI